MFQRLWYHLLAWTLLKVWKVLEWRILPCGLMLYADLLSILRRAFGSMVRETPASSRVHELQSLKRPINTPSSFASGDRSGGVFQLLSCSCI